MFNLRRVYEPPGPEDGFRVLVDRIWPRGISKQEARIDLWMREIAPDDDLRKWFGHDPDRWQEFGKRYRRELKGKTDLLDTLHGLEREKGVVTLLFGAKDERRNNAVALFGVLRKSR